MTALSAVGNPIPATPPAHSLLTVAQEVTDPARWDLGFTVCPENCVTISTIDPDCSVWPGGVEPDVALPAAPVNQDCYSVDPYTLHTSFECASTGFSTQDYPGRARRQMEAGTPKGLEYELWTGSLKSRSHTAAAGTTGSTVVASASVFSTADIGRLIKVGTGTIVEIVGFTSSTTVTTSAAHGGSTGNAITVFSPNPTLTNGATIIGSGTAYTPKKAIALLGKALSECAHGGRGVIHAPAWVADLAVTDNILKESGDKLITTVRGDWVAAGTGYTGTGPGNSTPAADRVFIYATGPVQYRLGDIMIFPDTMTEALDRSKNKIEYRAERFAAANFDPCCHFGIEVNVS